MHPNDYEDYAAEKAARMIRPALETAIPKAAVPPPVYKNEVEDLNSREAPKENKEVSKDSREKTREGREHSRDSRDSREHSRESRDHSRESAKEGIDPNDSNQVKQI